MNGRAEQGCDTYHNMKAKVGSSKRPSTEKVPLLDGRSVSSSTPPVDLCYASYFILYIHGVGHLLPWNFFITAKSYFEWKFTCLDDHSNSSCAHFIAKDFENYFSVSAMLPIALMAGFNIWLQSKVHYKYRLVVSLAVMMVLFMLTCVFVYIHTFSWTNGFFAVTLLTIVMINVFSAIFQSSTFGFAGVLPPLYTAGVMSGQACAGIFAALCLILTVAITSNDEKRSALGYFLTALIVVVICLVTFFLLMQLKFVRYFLEKTSVRIQAAKEKAIKKHSSNAKIQDNSPPFLKILLEVIVYAVSVFLVFGVTLSLFPAVLSNIKSSVLNPSASPWTS